MSIDEIIEKYPNSWKDIVQASDLNTAKAVIDEKRRLKKKKRIWLQVQAIAKSIQDEKVREEFLVQSKPTPHEMAMIEILGI